jgi:arginyl-tRNA synthetase
MPALDLKAETLAKADLGQLKDEGELALIKKLAQWPRLVEQAALFHEPHRVAFYLYDLASEFHSQWNRGKDAPHLRFIIEDNPSLTLARLSLVQGLVTALASGLAILGVRAAEEMR